MCVDSLTNLRMSASTCGSVSFHPTHGLANSQAEADTLMLGKLNAQKAYEAKVMKDVEGWVPGESVYSSRWVAPNKLLQRELDSVEL